MPLFSSPRPRGIAGSVAAMLSSKPELTVKDRLAIETAAATHMRNTALAEKAMQEVEAERAARQARENPLIATEIASNAAGIRLPQGQQLRRYLAGDVIPPATPMDDEGYEMPSADVQRPGDVSPNAERLFQAALAAIGANAIGTGKTSADNLSKAVGNFDENMVRGNAVGLPAPEQNARVGAYRATSREPFSAANPQGIVTNQESGSTTVAQPELHSAAVAALQALGGQRTASAGLSDARATVVPSQIERNQAQASASLDRAVAALVTAEAARQRAGEDAKRTPSTIDRNTAAADASRATAEGRRVTDPARARQLEASAAASAAIAADRGQRTEARETAAAQERARSGFRSDPRMKAYRLGAWEPGKGYRVLDKKTGAVVGHYD